MDAKYDSPFAFFATFAFKRGFPSQPQNQPRQYIMTRPQSRLT
jgi:hypothetical protein